MSSVAAEMTPRQSPRCAWWLRFHGALMPDYNRKAALFWWTAVISGMAVLVHAAIEATNLSAEAWAYTAGGTLLAVLAALVPVRSARSANSYTAGEFFLFLLLLMVGTPAATLAAAAESFVGSCRSSKRWTSRIASPAMSAVVMFCTGSALHGALAAMKARGWDNDAWLFVGAIVFALAYFVLNTVLFTTVQRLKRDESFQLSAFIESFGWLSVAYVGNASVATLVYLSLRHSGLAVAVAAVPIIVILLTTGHFYFRRQEAEDTVRRAEEHAAAQRQRMEHARQAGMAEIATNVLHNVGNVLNSVNLSAELICDVVRGSEGASLARAVQLMDRHADDLGRFLTEDPKGRLLPQFLKQLSQALALERQSIMNELETLTQSMRHIKEVVATQQSYARASSLTEPQRMSDLVEDALRISTGGPSTRHVHIVRDLADLPLMMLDKHRVLLILVNLISNAKHAVSATKGQDRQITVRLSRPGEGRLLVSVQDNGEGIASEHLPRIFAHGFTTKRSGHGFGLHSCVLAAQEMGGSLTAHSDGPGRGATFTLELPIDTPPTTP